MPLDTRLKAKRTLKHHGRLFLGGCFQHFADDAVGNQEALGGEAVTRILMAHQSGGNVFIQNTLDRREVTGIIPTEIRFADAFAETETQHEVFPHTLARADDFGIAVDDALAAGAHGIDIGNHIADISVTRVFVIRMRTGTVTKIFLTAPVFPLIPGPNLYYMMYGCLTRDIPLAFNETVVLLATCLAIALGFNIVDIGSRMVMHALKREFRIGKKDPFARRS